MKITNYLAGLSLFLLLSCEKGLPVRNTPSFDVSTAASTFKVGQEVLFKITGEADVISFYSGQVYNDYNFRDGRVMQFNPQGANLSFTSSVQGGTQTNQLAVLASTNFDGNYSSLASVKAATWTDITSRFTLGTSVTFLASTSKSITDLIVPGKPIYIAFKYVTKPQAVNGLARTWMIQGFNVTSSTLVNNVGPILLDQPYAAFRIVQEDSVNTPARSSLTSTRVTLLGNVYKDPKDPIFNPANPIYDPLNPIYDPTSPLYDRTAVRPTYVPYDPASQYNDPAREVWAVSQPAYTDKVNLGPDWSIPVRGIRNAQALEYRYTYTTAGTYKVYFVASNNTKDEKKR
jgi:hypothetical protein